MPKINSDGSYSEVVAKIAKPQDANRQRGINTTVQKINRTKSVATSSNVTQREFGSAGKYTSISDTGKIQDDAEYRNRIRQIQNASRGGDKLAGMFGGDSLGTADIADSNNIGMYSFEFPVDALELPSSRLEEIRYYRMAYDRDPVVARAIDLHTELPLSKLDLEKPKCSSEDLADFVFDYYQALVNDTKLFETLIEAVRDYWTIGEAFLFVEEDPEVEVTPCKVALEILKKNKGSIRTGAPALSPMSEAQNGSDDTNALEFLEPTKKSFLKKAALEIDKLKRAGINFDTEEDIHKVALEIIEKTALLKQARNIIRSKGDDQYPISITAAPDDEVAIDSTAPENGEDEGAPQGEAGLEGVEGGDGEDLGGDASGIGGGFSGGGGIGGGGDVGDDITPAIDLGGSIQKKRETLELQHTIRLLKKKKELLEELKEIREKKTQEVEIFSHIENPDYLGFDRIQVLPPEQIEIAAGSSMTDGISIYYKPPKNQLSAYSEDPDTAEQVKDQLAEEGKIELNQDPFKGSYVIHFARKKAGYELHGRSILQRCLRTIIYREKLRQVQSTIASRNMTPKTLVVAPSIPVSEVAALRAHIDEAKADPDYTIVVNYECTWQEIGSEGRLLSLEGEYQHSNSDLSIGLGFSPEILIGEGLYGGNRIQLEIMNTTYTSFRETISRIIEDNIFKPIAMKKGFYEMDKYGRPRWIFPKISFSRMALRDSGDLFDMVYNLYSKGSLPVSAVLEFLNFDPETIRRQLEEDLFTVNDSKFNDMLASVYGSISENIIKGSDIVKRVIKGLQLDEIQDEGGDVEGSGEGV